MRLPEQTFTQLHAAGIKHLRNPRPFVLNGDLHVRSVACPADLHAVRTMPRHFGEFVANGEFPGLVLLPTGLPIRQAIEDVLLIWHISEADEWTNRFRRLPL